MLSKYKQLEAQADALSSELQKLPKGRLICSHNGKYQKWYQNDGERLSYIPKKNRRLAEQLAVKKYYSILLEDLLAEKRAINFYLKHHRSDTGRTEQLLCTESEYQNLLTPYFTPLSQELSDWANSPYEHNLKNPEQLIHKSSSGHLVRSKSEAIIDMFLHINKIPFRYECSLQLGDITIFPDFTIRHPKTGEIYYWEHFGLMDNPTYSKNSFSKLQLYASQGIVPSIQLITTYETKENPLSAELVEKIIQHYFL